MKQFSFIWKVRIEYNILIRNQLGLKFIKKLPVILALFYQITGMNVYKKI